MAKAHAPELKKFMDKQVKVKLCGNRYVSGVMRGFDPFMNTVLDQAVDETSPDKPDMGLIVIRGNSILMLENLQFDPKDAELSGINPRTSTR